MREMADEEGFPSVAEYAGIVNGTAAGFSHATDGAGLRMYWVADQDAADPARSFGEDSNERTNWARDTRNAMLREFMHLMFASELTERPDLFGITSFHGPFVFVRTMQTAADDPGGFELAAAMSSIAAHEITHALQASGEDTEHRADADGNGTPNELSDKRFLMYPNPNPENYTTLLFDDWTRRHLDLTSKESVEHVI